VFPRLYGDPHNIPGESEYAMDKLTEEGGGFYNDT
jgi:hypothetical protein